MRVALPLTRMSLVITSQGFSRSWQYRLAAIFTQKRFCARLASVMAKIWP